MTLPVTLSFHEDESLISLTDGSLCTRLFWTHHALASKEPIQASL